MKRRLSEGFWAVLLALGLTAGSLGCFLSVYALPVRPKALTAAVLACLLLGVLLLPLRRGSELTLCACALTLGYLLHRPETVGAIKSLLYLVSLELDGVWHWGYFVFPGLRPGSVEIPLCVYGGILSLAVCRSVLRRRSGVLPLLLAAIPVVLCAMIPEASIPVWAVFLLLASAATLLLTEEARKNGAIQGIKLARAVCLPVALCVGLLLLCNPQSGYVDRAAPTRERILDGLRDVSATLGSHRFVPQVSFTTDLASLSGGEQPNITLMSVTAEETGPLYLRGQDFDTYTGAQWTADPGRVENFDGWGTQAGSVSLETYGMQDLIYLPYYPGAGTILTGGALANTGAITAYTFPCYRQGSAMGREALEPYLRLPEETERWARELIPQTWGPAEIGEWVRAGGVYDLRTPKMPEERSDFVRWFLEEAHQGYCVHFASAATVLLRAAGIPARYVTGFLVDAQAGKKTTVTTRQAHAWTEYYDIENGVWQILDATPSASGSGSAVALPTRPQEQTGVAAPPAGAEPSVSQETQNGWIVWLMLPGAALLLALRQWMIRSLWEYRKKRSGTRERVLLLWAEAEGLSKACGKEIPEELLELAQKARFSQHRITAMDAVPLETYCQACRERLQAAPWWKRLMERYVYARI